MSEMSSSSTLIYVGAFLLNSSKRVFQKISIVLVKFLNNLASHRVKFTPIVNNKRENCRRLAKPIANHSSSDAQVSIGNNLSR